VPNNFQQDQLIFGCYSTCWNWYFPIVDGVMRYINHVTPSCSLSSPTLWDLSGLIFSPDIGFFSRSPTQTKVCFTYNRCSFIYHASTFLLMCKSKGKHLIISLLYHTCISSILNPLPYNITYPSWLATSYGCPSFMMSMLTRSQVMGWNPLEGFTKSSCGKLRLGGMLPASNSRKG